MSERVGVVDDASFDLHRAPRRHPECPERLAAARSGLAQGLDRSDIVAVGAREARTEELVGAHTREHLRAMDLALDGSWTSIDADTFAGPGTRDAAFRAAGGAAELGARLARGELRRGFALVRPPGHHAERARAMGFCLFNNVAVAANAARAAGARRVAIVDWDVHHGNGTQDVFEQDPDVLFVSLHQWPLYPGTGAPAEIGVGAGVGRTANLALPPGCGDAEYAHALRRVVLPLLAAHAPDVILVSAGYDAHANDPLASMRLGAEAYGAMTSALIAVAEGLGHGKVGVILEGGYELAALEASVATTARALAGKSTALPEERVAPVAIDAVEMTRRALAAHWEALRGS